MEQQVTYETIMEFFRLSDERFKADIRLHIQMQSEAAAEERKIWEAERKAREAEWRAFLQAEAEERKAKEAAHEARMQKEAEERKAALQAEAEERKAKEAAYEARMQKEAEERKAALQAEAEERKAKEAAYEARMQKEAEERKKSQADFDRRLAKIADTVGLFAQNQVSPAALQLFQALNIPIYELGLNQKKWHKQENRILYEVDILLHNTDFVIAMEVKNKLRMEDIPRHIERLKLMQQYPLRGTKGTKIIGAFAAMEGHEEVVKFAAKKGMYVLLPNGENISIANPPDFEPAYWEISE